MNQKDINYIPFFGIANRSIIEIENIGKAINAGELCACSKTCEYVLDALRLFTNSTTDTRSINRNVIPYNIKFEGFFFFTNSKFAFSYAVATRKFSLISVDVTGRYIRSRFADRFVNATTFKDCS